MNSGAVRGLIVDRHSSMCARSSGPIGQELFMTHQIRGRESLCPVPWQRGPDQNIPSGMQTCRPQLAGRHRKESKLPASTFSVK